MAEEGEEGDPPQRYSLTLWFTLSPKWERICLATAKLDESALNKRAQIEPISFFFLG